MHSTGLRRSIGAAILLSSLSLSAHDSLYNYVEVRSIDDDSVRIEFTVHAAELAEGVDPNSSDLLWVEDLSEPEIEDLLASAQEFIEHLYRLPLPEGCEIVLPECEALRAAARITDAARPGCLVATATLPKKLAAVSLRYSPNAAKRLMLVTIEPGTFPKVNDLAPGEIFEIEFP